MALAVKLEVFEGPLDLLLHLIDKNKIDIYFGLSNTNSDTFEFAEELSHFCPKDTSIVILRWVETDNLSRYRGLAKEEVKRFCDLNAAAGVVLAIPGYVKAPAQISEAVKPGEQISILGYEYRDVLYRPFELTNPNREVFAKQAYFLESIGFRDTGYKGVDGNNIYIYISDSSKKYITRLIMNEIH